MAMDRQLDAVGEAVFSALSDNLGKSDLREIVAKSAIAASDASLVPGLVRALKDIGSSTLESKIWDKVQSALASLPPEYRNATQEQDDE